MEKICEIHPNPQFARESFVSLNGEWDAGFKRAKRKYKFSKDSSLARNLRSKGIYTRKINVPFCIESTLSGIGCTDFINRVWYRKTICIKKDGKRVFLHIGAADYLTTVLVNGKEAGRHKGGYTSFAFDITDLTADGENEIFILCEDDCRNPLVPRGKQCERKKSCGCDYTRTTGIWQSVYLEFVPESHTESFKIYPDPESSEVSLFLKLKGREKLCVTAYYEGREVGKSEKENAAGSCVLSLKLSEKHLWEAGAGRLYDLKIKFGDDEVLSYFGLRSVRLDGMKFLINEKSVFQRLVLDQGFYRDGIYTARDDEALKKDIELSMSVGFNGARLHQKVFDPRFLFFCDRAGYLVWGEYANWGLDYSDPAAVDMFLAQWSESVERYFNHPAIIGWCPFNETWDYRGRKQRNELLETVFDYTKAVDATRPCIDTSGNYHAKTDIYDLHDYDCDPANFKRNYDKFTSDGELYDQVLKGSPGRQQYGGQPVFISEYGGIKWETDREYKSWGYGKDVKTPEEFFERYKGLTEAILGNGKIFGFCYTQLYDIEQEQNGIFTYNREKKFSDEIYRKIREVNLTPAEIEK